MNDALMKRQYSATLELAIDVKFWGKDETEEWSTFINILCFRDVSSVSKTGPKLS